MSSQTQFLPNAGPGSESFPWETAPALEHCLEHGLAKSKMMLPLNVSIDTPMGETCNAAGEEAHLRHCRCRRRYLSKRPNGCRSGPFYQRCRRIDLHASGPWQMAYTMDVPENYASQMQWHGIARSRKTTMLVAAVLQPSSVFAWHLMC
ncbi:hypothetical protein IF1G_03505 [Cordyceps javanica]|uniref:Uncharacterized protein n=1 Tax=Cordyceps javanica TaxID=43265 RepID=A0A545W4Y6_9HYPO|nr:hypothetical protein IF1G_03505 [Cordyceps javanica]TQW09059.1 hypothetical protein IF2G_03490 [Cordyceps javanica]